MKRFATLTEHEIEEKRKLLTPKATTKSEVTAENSLRAYLLEKGRATDFENYSKEELDRVLRGFYLEARTKDGQLYKKSSIESFRYSLNRFLKRTPTTQNFDLLNDSDFSKSNESFKIAVREIKAAGKAEITHYPALSDADREKLYTSVYFDCNTPMGLYNKVQYDIRYYFCRRGGENMHLMNKDTFILNVNADTGKKYFTKRDELTKNHRADAEGHSGVMPETGTQDCPVASFMKFLSKLHPRQERLWCYTRNAFRDEDDFWYTTKPVGVNKMDTFLQDLSQKCGLSRIYTNHSLRATAATLLHQQDFPAQSVQSITGHKSLSSLSIYQRTSTKQKIQMATSLHQHIAGEKPRGDTTPAATVTSQSNVLPNSFGSVHCGEGMKLSDKDLDIIFNDENAPVDTTNSFAPTLPVFKNLNNCTININYNFK